MKSYNFLVFAFLSPLLIWLGLFNIIRYKYLSTLTHWGTVHVLRHPNEHSAQTQLVAVVPMTATHAKKNLNAQKKCKIQVLEKPAQQQNPH